MNIRTKQIRDKWHSFMTWEGYDWGEEGKTPEESQEKMRALISRMKWDQSRFTFLIPEPYVWQEREKNVPYNRPWLDHNPTG